MNWQHWLQPVMLTITFICVGFVTSVVLYDLHIKAANKFRRSKYGEATSGAIKRVMGLTHQVMAYLCSRWKKTTQSFKRFLERKGVIKKKLSAIQYKIKRKRTDN